MHFEFAAGRLVDGLVRAIEGISHGVGVLPERVWNLPDQDGLRNGRPTGAAMPLMWAHAEYVKLLRSISEGKVFDLIEPVAARYRSAVSPAGTRWEVWKPNRHVTSVDRGATLRIQAPDPFSLHWTNDGWQTVHDSDAADLGVGVFGHDFEDMDLDVTFTLHWADRWEGRGHTVEVVG